MVSATTETSITWTWNAVEGALGYAVQVSHDEMFDDADRIALSLEASFTAADLAPQTSLYLRVAAGTGTPEAVTAAATTGDLSGLALSGWTTHVTGMSNAPPPPVPPAAPSGLAATASGMDFIEWTWTAVEGATGYYAQFSTDEMFAGAEEAMAVEGTSYRRDGLDAGMTAYLRVASTDGTLMSDWSMHATGMTAMPDAPVPPAAPMGLSISATGADYIEWSWEAVDGATGYHVQFSTDEGMLMDSDAMAVDGTSHRQMGLAEGSTGYLRVRAVADDLSGMWTAHLTGMTGMTPAAPGTPEATATGDSITWTWDEVDGADGYQIQYSADGVFTGSTETMDAEGNSYTKDELTAGTSAFLRVRATSGGSGVQALLMSGWTMPQKGTTMTPQPPAVPTGLAAEGGEGSITWTWDEVDDATGYEVQFSTDPGFSDAETMMVEEGTSYTRMELDASTRGYLRVRAVNDVGSSDWAPTASGTTDAAVVTKAALEVSFTLSDMAKSPYYLIPVDGADDTDPDKAKAKVNTEIMVTSNVAVDIEAMWLDGAPGVPLRPQPFLLANWEAPQKDVVSEEGVTFKIIRDGTDGEKPDDVAYVTCGPFRCTESSGMQAMAPDITIDDSTTCNAWELDFTPEVGMVDNTINPDFTLGTDPPNEAYTGGITADDANLNTGIDFGWTYTSKGTGFTANHSLAIVNEKSGRVGMTSTETDLPVPNVGQGIQGSKADAVTGPPAIAEIFDPCEEYGGTTGVLAGNPEKPGGAECFRILANPNANYWKNYEVTITGTDTGVSWGKITTWERLKGHTCPAPEFKPVEEFDICEDLFADEIGRLTGLKAVAVFVANTTNDRIGDTAVTASANEHLRGFDLSFDRAERGEQFTSLYYMQSTTGKADAHETNTTDLYGGADNDAGDTVTVSKTAPTSDWFAALDVDSDPKDILGDLGLLDSNGDDKPDNFGRASDVTCSREDGGEKYTALNKGTDIEGTDQTDDDMGNGTLCDAKGVEFPTSITFVDGIGLGCKKKVEITVTCDWDADGGEAVGVRGTTVTRTSNPPVLTDSAAAGYNLTNFLTSCKATMN